MVTEILIYTVISTGTKLNFYDEITPLIFSDQGLNILKTCEKNTKKQGLRSDY